MSTATETERLAIEHCDTFNPNPVEAVSEGLWVGPGGSITVREHTEGRVYLGPGSRIRALDGGGFVIETGGKDVSVSHVTAG